MSYLMSQEASEHFTTELPAVKRTPPINFRKPMGLASVNTAQRAAALHDRKMREGDIEVAEAFLADTTSQWCRAIPNAERRGG